MALIWAWLSDGPLQGTRWPFIYAGAVLTVSADVVSFTHICS
jgi:ACS family pantothenate transporter-like MFS transporter